MPIVEGDHHVPLSDVMESLVKQHGVEAVLRSVDHLRAHSPIPPAPTDHKSMLALGNEAIYIARSLAGTNPQEGQNAVECKLKGSVVHRIVNCCLSLGNLITLQYKPKA